MMRGTIKLKKLLVDLESIEVKGSKEVEITGICSHSEQVAPGFLFIAKRGKNVDGTRFIAEAVKAGAVCVLTDLYDPFLPVTQLIHARPEKIEAKLAANFYKNPSSKLSVIGITGTNGKTTVCYLVKQLLGESCGLIGTIETIIQDRHFPSKFTTPDAINCQKLLSEMVEKGCTTCVMEVSSHGLDQSRVGEIDFDIGVFTNFSQDHLDYHQTMEKYLEAKQKLFRMLPPNKWAVMNADEKVQFKTNAKVLKYGIENDADLRASNIKLKQNKTEFLLHYKEEVFACKIPLIGLFNLYNTLAAISAALLSNLPIQKIIQKLPRLKAAKGRLELISKKPAVFVDYAHTPDALAGVLKTLTAVKKGKLITVFGCGGDRDQDKREKMGRVVAKLSDIAIVTSDNPRSEDPKEIARDILKGFSKTPYVEFDRKRAIQKALSLSNPEDIVLIAGKGHEKTQVFQGQVIPFDDAEVAKEVLSCV